MFCQLGRFEIKRRYYPHLWKGRGLYERRFGQPRVAHIFFEKANPNIRGLYQAINRDFLMHEFAETEFVNREEDMGLPGLRQAKMEYNPDHFAEKYDVVVKDGGCF